MPTITQLQYLAAVSRTGHFGRAAEECHVSQPALSAQLQKLEDELDTVVFDRTRHPIRVTDRGRAVLKQAQAVLREHQRLFEVSREGRGPSGAYHLGVIPTLSSSVIPLFVENFSRKYPAVDLTITEYKTGDIIRELGNDRIDGGLLVTPLHERGIREIPLFLEPFHLFVSDRHPLFGRKNIRDSDLDGSSVWLLDEGHCFREQVIRVCSLKDRNEVLKNVHFSSGSLETLINLVRRGRGYTLLPQLATTGLTAKEKRENLKPFFNPVPTREVSLVQSRDVLKQEITEALAGEIRQAVPDEIRDFGKKKKVEVIGI